MAGFKILDSGVSQLQQIKPVDAYYEGEQVRSQLASQQMNRDVVQAQEGRRAEMHPFAVSQAKQQQETYKKQRSKEVDSMLADDYAQLDPKMSDEEKQRAMGNQMRFYQNQGYGDVVDNKDYLALAKNFGAIQSHWEGLREKNPAVIAEKKARAAANKPNIRMTQSIKDWNSWKRDPATGEEFKVGKDNLGRMYRAGEGKPMSPAYAKTLENADLSRKARKENTKQLITDVNKQQEESTVRYEESLKTQQNLDRMSALSDLTPTGSWTGAVKAIAGFAQVFGVENSHLGALQAMDSIHQDFAQLRFAATKGAISNTEFKSFLASVPNAAMSPAGLAMLTNIMTQHNDWVSRRDTMMQGLDPTTMSKKQIKAEIKSWDARNKAFTSDQLQAAIKASTSKEVMSLKAAMKGFTGGLGGSDAGAAKKSKYAMDADWGSASDEELETKLGGR